MSSFLSVMTDSMNFLIIGASTIPIALFESTSGLKTPSELMG